MATKKTVIREQMIREVLQWVGKIDLELSPPALAQRIHRRHFYAADLVLSKGQGNFETLCEVKQSIFFLLKIKCQIGAANLNLPLGTHVLRQSRQSFLN